MHKQYFIGIVWICSYVHIANWGFPKKEETAEGADLQNSLSLQQEDETSRNVNQLNL